MPVKECEIIFDNPEPDAKYCPGQTIAGRVKLKLNDAKKVREIRIQFKGIGHTSWITGGSKPKSERTFIGSEEYFKTKYPLLPPQGDSIELKAGQHVYPFTFVLPLNLPSSFESKVGYVKYICKVTLHRPWKFDIESEKPFTVVSPLDLNLNPLLKQRAQLTVEKLFTCCFAKSGSLTCVVTIPCSGYIPGQSINITCEIDNPSDVQVLCVKFSIKKAVDYHSKSPKSTKTEEVKLTEISCPGVAEKSSKTFDQQLKIPSLPTCTYPNMLNCSLIDIHYKLQVVAQASGVHKSLKSSIPITIGTVPLTDIFTTQSGAVTMSTNQSAITSQGDQSEPPPPSYDECQFGTKTTQA